MALHSNIIDLTISDDESETRSYVPSRKRNGSHLTPSPVPIKKHNSDSPPSILVSSLNGASRSHLPVNSVKEDRILEGNIRKFINHPDGPSQELPKNIFANVLIKPQLHLTPRTATGFGPSNDARPPVELDKEDLKRQVKLNLSLLNGPKVKIVNHIDSSSPPVNFAFINENYVGVGVEKVPAEYMSGCDCKQENGRSIG